MSWSITAEGTPDEIVAKLNEYGRTLDPISQQFDRMGFEEALPHLQVLLQMNRLDPEPQTPQLPDPKVKLTASGSNVMREIEGYNAGVWSFRVSIKPVEN